jgi:hypothetical protein
VCVRKGGFWHMLWAAGGRAVVCVLWVGWLGEGGTGGTRLRGGRTSEERKSNDVKIYKREKT